MNFTITREMERFERGMNFLASIGSVSPFIGLLGTVWGIMSSFQSIAESKNTSLAVVAPGIAEALFATALASRRPFPLLWPITNLPVILNGRVPVSRHLPRSSAPYWLASWMRMAADGRGRKTLRQWTPAQADG